MCFVELLFHIDRGSHHAAAPLKSLPFIFLVHHFRVKTSIYHQKDNLFKTNYKHAYITVI